MTRNRDIAQILGKTEAENTTNASLGDGSGGSGSGVIAYSHDSSGGLLSESTTGHTDGSLHWLGALNELYVWDSAATKYYLVENTKTIGLGEVPPTQAQGSTYGFASGGASPSSRPSGNFNNISRFAFVNETSASDHGDLTVSRDIPGGNSSSTHGYSIGGFLRPAFSATNVIDKFAMASSANATDVGDDTVTGYYAMGSPSPSHGYHAGGFPSPSYTAVRRYSFSSDENASSVGTLSNNTIPRGSYTSTTHGFQVGHGSANAVKYPFAASGVSSVTVGTLDTGAGQAVSAADAGYYSQTYNNMDIIKTPFATDVSSTVNTFTSSTSNWYSEGSTSSSQTDGYWQGHNSSNSIYKFNFASNGSVTDVADLANAHGQNSAGHQV